MLSTYSVNNIAAKKMHWFHTLVTLNATHLLFHYYPKACNYAT